MFLQSFSQEEKYIEIGNVSFLPQEKAYLFGDDVKFRIAPNQNSKVLKLLKINTEVTVLSKEENYINYNGINWNWYKVKFNNEIGYIVGGLLSLDKKEIGDSVYLTSLKYNIKEENTELLLRLVDKKKLNYVEYSEVFRNVNAFSVKVFGNRGVSNIKNMVLIDYIADACGVEGGGSYFFNVDDTLIKAIEFSEFSEAGMFWIHEKVIFPKDHEGKEGKIIFVSEQGRTVNEETNHTKTVTDSIEFT